MKNLFILMIILSSSSISGQDLTELNHSLGLTDSLINQNEIRIYKGFGITNYTGIFRMYQDSSNNWRAEMIDHFAKVSNKTKLKIKRRELKPSQDLESIWWDLLKTNIQDLPDMAEIEWKLKKNPQIVEVMGQKVLSWQKTAISDGESYVVSFRLEKNLNEVTYWNPESYLRIYENIDELIYFNELLNLVRTKFGVWKNN